MTPEASEWIHLWSNTSATGSTVAGHPHSSDPLNCGCFGNDPVTTGCASTCTQGNGYDYGHWLAKDATAWGLVDIVGTHEYDSQKAEPWPADVDGGKRSKEIWETEVSGVMYWPEQGPTSDIGNGIAVAGGFTRRSSSRGFGLALLVVPDEQRQRRLGPPERNDDQALLHNR